MQFTGFSMETLDFFADIRHHNEVAWFEENRETYMRYVREPFVALAEQLAPIVLSIDDKMDVRPIACLSRMRRDARFSRNKLPYRDHMWLGFRHRGVPKEQSFILYFDLYIDSANIGMGCYGPQRAAMELLREDLLKNPKPFRKLIGQAGERFAVDADLYKRRTVPEGIDADMQTWFLAKNMHVHRNVFEHVMKPELSDIIAEDFLAMRDLYHYMLPFFAEAFGY